MNEANEIPLDTKQRVEIYRAIHANIQPGDRYPSQIIADHPYNGNEEAYLRAMAEYHGLELN